VNFKIPTETVLSIYSIITDGKISYVKTALLEIEFSGTAEDPAMFVSILIDDEIVTTKQLSTEITRFKYNIPDSNQTIEHELRIEISGRPIGAMLHIRSISIEGLCMRSTMSNSGTSKQNGEPAVPSEYMGQLGYQSLKFTTPIYPWLLANESDNTYYYPHYKIQWQNALT
jgi:hypothetical protein